MLHLGYAPEWFSGVDLILDFLGALVLTVVAIIAWKYYSLNKKNKNELLLFLGMSMLAVSLILKILSYYSIYLTIYKIVMVPYLGQMLYQAYAYNPFFFYLFIGHVLLKLLGLLTLLLIFEKVFSVRIIIIILFFILLVSYLSIQTCLFFYITSLVLTTLVATIFWENYKRNNLKSTHLLAWSFTLLSISRLLFIFTMDDTLLYVFAELVQVTAYLLMLFALLTVFKNAKKKR